MPTARKATWVARLPEPILRAARTFLQAFTTIWLAAMVSPNMAGSVPHKSAMYSAVLAAVWGGLIAVVTLVHNSLEEAGVVPPVLKPVNEPIDGGDPGGIEPQV